MPGTKSEKTAADAFDAYRDGDLRTCIFTLVEYADRHVRNRRTAFLFKQAIDAELAAIIADVSKPDKEAPPCSHCGSPSTYIRCSDGDIGCNNCPGIMPVCNDCDRGVTTYEPDEHGNCPYCGTPKEVEA